MAAPATTTRIIPPGIKLLDGFSTVVAFALDPNVNLWEIGVTPPGVDGGDTIEVTNMHNVTWRTFEPRALYTLTELAFTSFYDPVVYTEILSLVNVRGSITTNFPDGSTLDFYGYLRTFEPQEIVEGDTPQANVTIQPTNWDPVNNVEADPVVTEVSGT